MTRTRSGRILLAVIAIALTGAALFGVWHLVVGGVINGIARAGVFGLVLAVAAGVPLVGGAWRARGRPRDTLAA